MYQNIFIKKNKFNYDVHLWDDQIGYKKVTYKPYAYMKSAGGTYQSIYGDKLKKVTRWDPEDEQRGIIFESDVPVETRVLVDMYGDSDEPSVGHVEFIFDIEVEVTEGFPDPNKAENPITSIAFYDRVMDDYHCLILGNIKNYKKDNIKVESFESEEELLQRFYQKYCEIRPTVLSGWNIDGFDIPYLYNRTVRVLGQQFADSLSPIGEIYYNERQKRFKIAGVSCLDYMRLYKWFTYTQQSSYRLDFIGQLEVGIGKIEYNGTLNDLYRDDIKKFIDYNLNDVFIVKALDDKLKFIDLARGVSHLGHIGYEDNFLSSRYLEGAMLVYMKKLGLVAPNKPHNKMNDNDKFSGAWVKTPKSGLHDWVYDLDLTSMYPSTIMTLNISPETKLGKLVGWDAEEFVRGVDKTYSFVKNDRFKHIKFPESFNTVELNALLNKNKISVSSNGVLYKYDKAGLIPSILEKWFNERVEYKTLMKKYGNEGDDEKYGYFKRRQHIQKIILNSLYGVLGLPVFRFYDVDNAEATTVTGVELIKFTEKIGNYYYNKQLGDTEDYCIYTDTDSVFYSAVPLIKHRNPNADLQDDEYMTKEILSIAGEVQDFINESYNHFASKFLNIKGNHRFDIKQEVIAKSGFWVTKKRYGQWIINDGGVQCDKLDVKGLDIVRSNFPPAMRDLMKNVLQMILSNEPKNDIDNIILAFKKSMKTEPIENIALPTGVKSLVQYRARVTGKFGRTKKLFTETVKGTPVHVKSAIIYNDLLKYHKLNNVETITGGNKIKWIYLKQNPFNIKTVAFKGYEDPKEIMDFIDEYIDYDKLFESALVKKIKMFYEALKWEMPIEKENTLERFF